MKTIGNVIVFLTALSCVVVLGISVYPGVLNSLLFTAFLFSILIVPVGGAVALVAFLVLMRKGKLQGVNIPWKQVGVLLVLLCSTIVLLKLYVPRRIAFAASRSSFQQLVGQAPLSEFDGADLNRSLGVYHVDQYAADPRGGVYFRVHLGPDGMGPDRMSYGFAYEPNTQGTPFGAASYRVFRLGNGWFWFRASDDFY